MILCKYYKICQGDILIAQDNLFYNYCNVLHTFPGAVLIWYMSHPNMSLQLEVLTPSSCK